MLNRFFFGNEDGKPQTGTNLLAEQLQTWKASKEKDVRRGCVAEFRSPVTAQSPRSQAPCSPLHSLPDEQPFGRHSEAKPSREDPKLGLSSLQGHVKTWKASTRLDRKEKDVEVRCNSGSQNSPSGLGPDF